MDIEKAFNTIARQIAKEEGLFEIAKLYPGEDYVIKKRSNGWAVSIWRTTSPHTKKEGDTQ